MSRKFFSGYFWVTWVALSIASSLFLLETFRVSRSTVEVAVLPQAVTAVPAPGNAVALIQSESFADRVRLKLESEGRASGADIHWEQQVTAALLPNSSIVAITVTDSERAATAELSQLVLQELAASLSRWYDVRTELDLRVLDGPRLSQGVSSWPRLVGSVLALASVTTTVFFLVLQLVERAMSRTMRRAAPGLSEYRISPDTFRPSPTVPYWSEGYQEEPTEFSTEPLPVSASETATRILTEQEESVPTLQETYQGETVAVESVFQEQEEEQPLERTETVEVIPSVREYALTTGRAPDNLPIAESLSPLEQANARIVQADINAVARAQAAEAQTDFAAQSKQAEAVMVSTGEPTQADYKRRLNELLSGRL